MSTTTHYGPTVDDMAAMSAARTEAMTWRPGDGYWAKQISLLLRAHPNHYRVAIGSLGHPSHRTPGVIYRRGASGGKYGRSAATRLGPDIQPCIDMTETAAAIRFLDGRTTARSAPRGYSLGMDDLGLHFVRLRDGEKWHFAARDVRPSSELVREMMVTLQRRDSERREQRAQAISFRRQNKDALRAERLYRRDLPTTRVSIEDSRRAGNCAEGTLKFAERALGISREDVVAGGYLLTVSAERILSVAGPGVAERCDGACRSAWRRETMVAI